MTVTLRPIDDANRDAVLALRVAPDQEQFVATVAQSLEDAVAHPEGNPTLRAIYAGDEPVGFLMLADPVERDGAPRYYLWRLLIDAAHQRRGTGRAALDELVAYVRTRPGAERIVVSAVPGPGSPIPFYLGYGFQPTGRVEHDEEIFELPL